MEELVTAKPHSPPAKAWWIRSGTSACAIRTIRSTILLSRSRAPPDCIERDDIMEFTLDGTPVDPRGRAPYLERFIHGALYEARPDVMSVVHNHSVKRHFHSE